MKKIIMLIMAFMLCFGIGFANAESEINFGDITEVNGSDLTQNYIYADYDYSLNETEFTEFDMILLELNYMYDDEYVNILEYTYGLVEPNLFYSDSEYINSDDDLTPLIFSFNEEIGYDSYISQDFGLVAENESMVYEIFSENFASASVSGYRIIELTSLDNLTGAEFESMSLNGEDALEDLYVIEDDGDLKQFTLGGWNVTDFKNLKMIFEGSEPLVFEARDGDYLEIDQTIAVGYGNNYSVNVYCSRSLLGDYPDNKVLWAFNTTNLWSGDYEIITHIFFGENGEYTTEARYYSLTSDIDAPTISIIDSPDDNAVITDNYIDVQVEYDYSSYLNEGWNFEKIIIYATDEELNYVNHLAYEHVDDLSDDLNNITRLYLDEGTYIYNVYVELWNDDLEIDRDFRSDYQTINIEAEEAEMTTNLDTENQLINLITIFLILGMIYFLYDKIFKGKK